MLTLIFTALVSILFGIFATQNTGLVTLNFGGYFLPTLPIYIAILIPILITLIICLGIQIVRNFSTILTIRSQKSKIKTLKREIAECTKNLHKMELENAKFKTEIGGSEDTNSI